MAAPKALRIPDPLLEHIEQYQKKVGVNFTDAMLLLIKNGLSLSDNSQGNDINLIVQRLDEILRLNIQIAALCNAIAHDSGEYLVEEAESHAREMLSEIFEDTEE